MTPNTSASDPVRVPAAAMIHTPATATDTRSPRRHVALDLETTGLDTLTAHPLEIAAVEINLDAAGDDDRVLDTMRFIPHTDQSVIRSADPDALATNRWYERRLYREMLTPAATAHAIADLVAMLDGATLVGANPAYDAAILWRWLVLRTDLDAPPWHFRLFDVEVATAAALGLDRIPSLSGCLDALDLDPLTGSLAHTALGDTFATVDVFHALRRRG